MNRSKRRVYTQHKQYEVNKLGAKTARYAHTQKNTTYGTQRGYTTWGASGGPCVKSPEHQRKSIKRRAKPEPDKQEEEEGGDGGTRPTTTTTRHGQQH